MQVRNGRHKHREEERGGRRGITVTGRAGLDSVITSGPWTEASMHHRTHPESTDYRASLMQETRSRWLYVNGVG